ncbi:hypothetical protein [Fundidesulfovibrio putealis]|uniref:hypothetical protein n=1 Tax=Fundidesulfovibrio putealis TaxID=270496 RepID=UPI0012EC491E|nr:hypothetical protein [Fundidesulfovibrio putealis]
MGLLNNGLTAVPQNERQAFDDNSFSQLFNSLYGQYQNQDPIDRQTTWAAQRQQNEYLNNKTEWDKILQSGGDLPSTGKPMSLDPAESEQLNKKWNAKWETPFQMQTGQDEKGNATFQNVNLRPLNTYGYGDEFKMTPDYYSNVKNLYQQYGPNVLSYIFGSNQG